jgi:sporulation protein YlmC with PRC-barrel domain
MERNRMQPAVLSASTLEGDAVVNLDGERLGTLKEIMIDIDRGEIGYVVLSRGGVVGIGEKLYAIPWGALTVDTDSEKLILDLEPDALDESDGFDPDNWPQFSDQEWGKTLHHHYGIEPYWTRGVI